MRDFKFTESERPTMANFNARFDAIAALANGLGNEYVWEKSYISVSGEETASSYGITSTSYSNLTYAKSIDENLSLYDTFVPAYPPGSANSEYWESLLPFYIKASSGYIMKVTRFGTFYENNVGAYGEENLVVTKQMTYVNSADQNAYPPAVSDGYTYTALGQLGSKVRIATGSYVGTGTYGASNPNSLTFEFVPRLVVITGMKYSSNVNYDGAYNAGIRGTIIPQFLTSEYTKGCPPYKDNGSDGAYTKKSSDGKTITWYNSSDYYQINSTNATYTYIAIG